MLNVEQFLYTLPIMAKGMAGIFIVTLIIIGCIAALNGISGAMKRKQDEKAAQQRN